MIWKTHDSNPRLQKTLSESLGITPLFAQILINREIRTVEQAQSFLFGDLSSCHDPRLLKDMDRAAERIKAAVNNKEKILVYGDYDVDGVTSTALLADVLREMGAECETFIPNRMEEGYGLNIRAVALARDRGTKLMITVDCGINSVEEVECANRYGIDVIITDHHEVKTGALPPAYAIVDPHQEGCKYPFKSLAGVGIAYKLARVLTDQRKEIADRHMDLVALGTIADVAPLNGENRILAKIGLEKLRVTDKPGLKALMDVAGVDQEKLTCRNVGFALGPRINAMGRVGSADVALELFTCKEASRGREIAAILDRENRNRQSIEKNILKDALEKARRELDIENDKVVVLGDETWHPGVIGIVASRLAEEFLKPAILIAFDGDFGKGSGRTFEGFNLFRAISASGEYLVDFGGHEAACGVRIKRDKLDDFRKKINGVAESCFEKSGEALPELKIDLNIPFSRVGVKLINELRLLMPHGPANAEPVFSTKGLMVKTRPREIGRNGFKFLATCGDLTCEAITFRKNGLARPAPGDRIDLAYTPSINSYGGIDSIQLNIKDIQVMK
jgi:single-stranded-DNA-specific exonuclease